MTRFITQGYKWESGGPISPIALLNKIVEGMERAAFVQKDRGAFEAAKDQLALFAEAHLKEGAPELWREYGLTRQMGIIADLLYTKLGRVVRDEEILNAMYFDRPNGAPGQEVIKVRMSQIRKKLKPAPYIIETIWCEGYRMVMKPDANRMAA